MLKSPRPPLPEPPQVPDRTGIAAKRVEQMRRSKNNSAGAAARRKSARQAALVRHLIRR